jgi:hypothetical protein
MLIGKKSILFLYLLLSLKVFTSEVPNIIVQDNPDRETPILNLEQRNRPAELSINITKLSTEEITALYSRVEKKYYFQLSERLKGNEEIFVTDNKDVLLKKKVIGKPLDYFFDGNTISIEDKNSLNDIYIVKYNRTTKELIKLYKWNKVVEEYKAYNKFIELNFLSTYTPYEEIKLNNSKIGRKVSITGGEILKLEQDTREVEVYDIQGKKLETIQISNGNGEYGLKNDISGITLRNSNGYLTTGIGFESGDMVLKLKEWSSKNNRYEIILKIKSETQEINYKVSLIPPKIGLRVLDNKLNFDFGKINSKNRFISTITSSVDIVVPKDTTSINAEFSENYDEVTRTGTMTLFRDTGKDTIILGLKIEDIIEKGNGLIEGTKLYNIPISSKLEEDISNKPAGTYSGETELIIRIDS